LNFTIKQVDQHESIDEKFKKKKRACLMEWSSQALRRII